MLQPYRVLLLVCLSFYGPELLAENAPASRSAEKRALSYLSKEVPRWSPENGCYSCHHNGDAARALYRARSLGLSVAPKALADTTQWLKRPRDWKENGSSEAFSDKTLATLQFAVSLAAATEAKAVSEKRALKTAAEQVAGLQQSDGSWKIDGPETIGSPTTWGRPLTTVLAYGVLVEADSQGWKANIRRAEEWLRTTKPKTVLEAGSLLIGLGSATDQEALGQKKRCLEIIRKGEAPGGGWGPYRYSPPEPFDTAVVLIGLSVSQKRGKEDTEMRAMIGRGRSFLIENQLPNGSWPETTRPADGTSRAQRLSTAGWATEALLLTRSVAEEDSEIPADEK